MKERVFQKAIGRASSGIAKSRGLFSFLPLWKEERHHEEDIVFDSLLSGRPGLFGGGASGANFCVRNETELKDALTRAGSNGDDKNFIRVVQGTYKGHFTYSSSEGHLLYLEGGYRARCRGRVVNPANTILDGGRTGRVLTILNGGDIQVDGFAIRNGRHNGHGGGIYASTYSASGTAGSITLLNNSIQGNRAGSGYAGGGVYATARSDSGIAGNITLVNNTIQGNIAPNMWGGGGVYRVVLSYWYSGYRYPHQQHHYGKHSYR